MEPHEVFAAAREQILAEAYDELHESQHKHYQAAGEEITRQRLADLFDLVVTEIRDRELITVVKYATDLAYERFDAGFDISEVQGAFNVLEKAMWRQALAVEPAAELAECVGLLSTVLGVAKDALARGYVSRASHRHVASLDLTALFDGAGS